MQSALVNHEHRPDADGVVLLDWPNLVKDGQRHWLCLAEGEPEPEVVIATDLYGRRIGISTGRWRPCAVSAGSLG